jgi:hypothetical protein
MTSEQKQLIIDNCSLFIEKAIRSANFRPDLPALPEPLASSL